MIEKIGCVELDYTFYKGKDYYSDGDETENRLIDIVRNNDEDRALHNDSNWALLYHLSDWRENILEWYPIEKNADILEVGSGCGALSGMLCKKAKSVTCIELSKRRSIINAYRNKECTNLSIIVGNFKDIKLNKKYDYITLIGVFEYASSYIGGKQPYKKMLSIIKQYLKPNGKIIIAIENKMGLKYLNGAKEDHVGIRFAGIEDYRNIEEVRTFSKPELTDIIRSCGFEKMNFYYPMPDYKLPDTIYSDRFMPRRGFLRTWNANYSETRIALYNEAIVWDQVCKDAIFDYVANSFLVVVNEQKNDIQFVHYRKGCKKEYQTKTMLVDRQQKQFIEKTYLFDMERKYDIFKQMLHWHSMLQNEYKNVNFLSPHIDKNGSSLSYEYLDGKNLEEKIAELVHNTKELIEKLKAIIQKVYQYDNTFERDFIITEEYKKIFGEAYIPTSQKSLYVTNVDMLLQNMVFKNEEVYCFDYEWVFNFPIPYEFVIYRSINVFYNKYGMYFSKNLSRKNLLIQLGIQADNIDTYDRMEKNFQEYIYGINLEEYYLKKYEKPKGMIEFNGI